MDSNSDSEPALRRRERAGSRSRSDAYHGNRHGQKKSPVARRLASGRRAKQDKRRPENEATASTTEQPDPQPKTINRRVFGALLFGLACTVTILLLLIAVDTLRSPVIEGGQALIEDGRGSDSGVAQIEGRAP